MNHFVMISFLRFLSALRVAGIHLLSSVAVALVVAVLVLEFLYPFPYSELSGGYSLLLLIVVIDVICGPLLTLVLFDIAKPRSELWRDLGLVMVIQLGALGYGLWTVWEARPLFLVHEVDRFKVITARDIDLAAVSGLPAVLQPSLWSGPLTVAIRPPMDAQERQSVLFDSIQGGRDYAERPEFYVPYDSSAALKVLERAQPLSLFLKKQPAQKEAALKLAIKNGDNLDLLLYVPVIGRQDWIAVLNSQGNIEGFLPGDGF